jgi:hypothetical protein
MRRRTLLVVLAGLAVVVAAGAVVLWPTQGQSPVTVQKYDQIRVSGSDVDPKDSMNRVEVVGLLGPPGDYTTRPTLTPSMAVGFFAPFIGDQKERRTRRPDGFSPAIYVLSWQGDDLTISVVFDASHRVWSKRWVKNEPEKLGTIETRLWYAKRQWRRWFP